MTTRTALEFSRMIDRAHPATKRDYYNVVRNIAKCATELQSANDQLTRTALRNQMEAYAEVLRGIEFEAEREVALEELQA